AAQVLQPQRREILWPQQLAGVLDIQHGGVQQHVAEALQGLRVAAAQTRQAPAAAAVLDGFQGRRAQLQAADDPGLAPQAFRYVELYDALVYPQAGSLRSFRGVMDDQA